MFIIIEGTDASGKSTLIEAVHAEAKRRYPDRKIHLLHKSRPEEETRRWVIKDYVLSVENIDLDEDIIIADRWHWGEATYAPLKRPHTDKDGFGLLGEAGWRWTELFLASRGVAHFWLRQPLPVIKKRLLERGDDYVKVDELGKILKLCKKASKHSYFSVKVQPKKSHTLEHVPALAGEMLDWAESMARGVEGLRPYKHYIGGVNPSVLLVGDERPSKPWYGDSTKLPFIPVDGNSGNYLMSSLRDDFWRNVGIVNANESPETFLALWTELGNPNIVALGREAEKTLAKLGLSEFQDYAVLPHPQFVRRFFNKRKGQYGKAIARISKKINSKDEKWILR
jgi:hypothetical protein